MFFSRDITVKLNGKIEDLEDVRYVMNMLKEIRMKEADIDNLIGPIEEMYALLMRYDVRVPKEESSMVSDLRYGWKKLRKLATDVSDNLARVQVHLLQMAFLCPLIISLIISEYPHNAGYLLRDSSLCSILKCSSLKLYLIAAILEFFVEKRKALLNIWERFYVKLLTRGIK